MNGSAIEAVRALTYEEERGKPMPSQQHSAAQVNLIIEFARQREFRVFSELNVRMGGRDFTPDICVYPAGPVDWVRDTIRVTEPPLTIVEIFSPQQGTQEVLDRVEVYLANGVKSCWLVAPPLQTITVRTADGSQRTYASGQVTDPVTGLEARIESVFA